MHSAGFKELNIPFSYCVFDTENTAFAIQAMKELGFRGFSLSIPHKEKALTLIEEVSTEAKRAGAINTIINHGNNYLTGHNTDIIGAKNAITEKSQKLDSALVIGAGGAARAAICALEQLRVKEISICNRSQEKTDSLIESFITKSNPLPITSIPWSNLQQVDNVNLIINATPIGSHISSKEDTELFLQQINITPKMVFFDMVTYPTKLQSHAQNVGATVIPGHKMLLFQALEQFRLFTEMEPPHRIMEQALLSELEKYSTI